MQIIITDVHIRPHEREDHDRFLNWLAFIRPRAEHIYILGDLFDYWFSGLEAQVDDLAQALNEPGITILPGNRDFLLRNSAAFPHVYPREKLCIENGGRKFLLTHGHQLLRGDCGFKLLHRLGWPLIKKLDRILPAAYKKRLAQGMVKSSKVLRAPQGSIPLETAGKAGVDTVICGHLHREFCSPQLIIIPAFLDRETWLELEDGNPVLRTRA